VENEHSSRRIMISSTAEKQKEEANKKISLKAMTLSNAKQKVNEMVDSFGKEYVIPNKIRLSTVCQLYKDFRLSIF